MSNDSNKISGQSKHALIEKLSEKQKANTKLLSLLDECIFECDNLYTLTYMNSAWTRLLGYLDSELLGCSLPDLLHEKSIETFCFNLAKEPKEQKGSMRFEVLIGAKSGEHRWFEMRIVKNDDEGFIGSLFDIQNHKEIENRLRIKEEEARKLSLVASHTKNMVIITDQYGHIEWVNRSFEKATGYSIGEAIGHKPGKLLQGPLTDQSVVDTMSAAVKDKQSFYVEIINYNLEGTPYWVAIDATPVKDKKGQISHFIAIESDISLRVKAEQLASEAEYNYRLVVDNISEVVLRLQPDGCIVFMNHAWGDLVKLPESQSMHKKITEFVNELDKSNIDTVLNQFSEGLSDTYRLELQIKRDDGICTWAEMSMTPIRDKKGELTAIAATLVNVDERVSAAIALKEAKQYAEGLADAKSRFLANISHEIRTPLNAMIGSSEILQDTGLNQEQQRYSDMIQSSGSALLSILDDVLTYSRFDAGAVVLENRTFDLGGCIDEAVDILSDSALKKQLKLIVNLSAKAPINVTGDNVRFRQVLINLLANAVKFTAQGEININIEWRYGTPNKGSLFIQVTDTGIGIAKDKLSQLFEPFVQSDVSTTRQFGGSGLGLSICRQICEAAGGTIEVSSQINKGSTFSVVFPLEIDNLSYNDKMALLPEEPLLIWVIGKNNRFNNAIIQVLKRYKISYKIFESTADLPDSFIKLADYIVVTSPEYTDNCRQYLQPYFSQSSPPFLIVLNLLGRGKFIHWSNGNELLVNGPFKISHMSRIVEQIQEILGKASITLNDDYDDHTEKVNFENTTVLVVEDNQQNQIIIEQFLLSCGCQVLIANQGAEALKQLQTEKVDLVLMDVQMPIMDGLTATSHIRSSNEHFKDIPIIAVTADAVYGDKERYLKSGMNDYLPKPIIRADLYRLLKNYLPEYIKEMKGESKAQRLINMKSLVTKLIP